MNNKQDRVHLLAFGAHADDVEVGAGGTLIRYTKQNKKTGIIDLTQSERSSNGTKESRTKEASNAANIMGTSFRKALNFPDGNVTTTEESIMTVANLIRIHQPEVVLAPYWVDRHPDHVATSHIVKNAALKAGMKAFETDSPPHKPRIVLYYMLHGEFTPDITINISDYFEEKLQAIGAYSSQFEYKENTQKTAINCGRFAKYIYARSQVLGYHIGADFGEGFVLSEQRIGAENFEHIQTKPI
ncbi:MAG: bacillithiol biosynthesis deacetylase BshB1 [Patescibacteria group bacterium]